MSFKLVEIDKALCVAFRWLDTPPFQLFLDGLSWSLTVTLYLPFRPGVLVTQPGAARANHRAVQGHFNFTTGDYVDLPKPNSAKGFTQHLVSAFL